MAAVGVKGLNGALTCGVHGHPVEWTGRDVQLFDSRIISVNRRRKDRRKTPIINNSQDPAWNQQFIFTDVTRDQLQNCCGLEITVWDHERFTTSNFLGAIHLNAGTHSDMSRAVFVMGKADIFMRCNFHAVSCSIADQTRTSLLCWYSDKKVEGGYVC